MGCIIGFCYLIFCAVRQSGYGNAFPISQGDFISAFDGSTVNAISSIGIGTGCCESHGEIKLLLSIASASGDCFADSQASGEPLCVGKGGSLLISCDNYAGGMIGAHGVAALWIVVFSYFVSSILWQPGNCDTLPMGEGYMTAVADCSGAARPGVVVEAVIRRTIRFCERYGEIKCNIFLCVSSNCLFDGQASGEPFGVGKGDNLPFICLNNAGSLIRAGGVAASGIVVFGYCVNSIRRKSGYDNALVMGKRYVAAAADCSASPRPGVVVAAINHRAVGFLKVTVKSNAIFSFAFPSTVFLMARLPGSNFVLVKEAVWVVPATMSPDSPVPEDRYPSPESSSVIW